MVCCNRSIPLIWVLTRDEQYPAQGFFGCARAIALVLALLSAACGSTPPSREVRLASRAVSPRDLTSDEVARAVVVTRRPQDIIVRGPTMQVTDRVRLVVDGNDLGTVQQARAGFLFGVRRYDTATAQHFLSFQSDIIEGTNRFAR